MQSNGKSLWHPSIFGCLSCTASLNKICFCYWEQFLNCISQTCQTRCFQQAYERKEIWESVWLTNRINSIEEKCHSYTVKTHKQKSSADKYRMEEQPSRQAYSRKGSEGLISSSRLNMSRCNATAKGTNVTPGMTSRPDTSPKAHTKMLLLHLIKLSCPVLNMDQSVKDKNISFTRKELNNWSYFIQGKVLASLHMYIMIHSRGKLVQC